MFGKLKQKYLNYQRRRLEGRIESYGTLIRKLNVHKVERKAAIDFFCTLTDHPVSSVTNLLKRFDFSDDNSIIDTKEKEQALSGIISLGDAAVPYLMDYLKDATRIGWPLKALTALTSKQQVSQILFDLLDISDIHFDHTKVEKNYDLLSHLGDYEFYGDTEDINKVVQLIRAKDERVRLAALEFMTEKIIPSDHHSPNHNTEIYLKHIEPFIYDESAESTRLRLTALEAYAQHGWRLKDKDRFSRYQINGYHIHKNGSISKTNQSASLSP